MGEDTKADAIYYHGRMALYCAAFVILLSLAGVLLSFPFFFVMAIIIGGHAGYHIGNVAWRSFHV